MITLVEHHHDHDVVCHQLTDADRHAAAAWITDHLLPRVVEGWRHASDAELACEVRRLAGQRPSELTTLLLNLVTDEQVSRAVASC
jgi:2C-methyl-D-erythritol 2,4-cyclodiphosphate synthase